MPDGVLIFANRIAGRGLAWEVAQAIAGALRVNGVSTEMMPDASTARAGEVEARLCGARAVVAIGGDGTVRAVVDHVIRCPDRPPPVLLVPMGTANLLAQHLGLIAGPNQLADRAVQLIQTGRRVEFDLALARGQPMLLMTGIGIDAEIVHQLQRIRSGPITKMSYTLPAALTLAFYRYPPISVQVDDVTVLRDEPALCFVGNVKEYGTGFPMLPHARPDDGLLDVCVLKCRDRPDALMHFLRAAVGEHLQAESAMYLKGRQVRIDSSQPVPVQIDGDAAGFTPIDIEMTDRKVTFLAD